MAEERSKEAYQAKQKFKPTHSETRKTFIESLAAELEKEGNIRAAMAVRARPMREQQRKDSRLIKRAQGKLRDSGISFVIAPDESGEWNEVRTKEGIERACLKENNRRFRQASDTPFLQPPLFDLVGPLGMGPDSDDIIGGDFVAPEGTDPHAVRLLEHLKMPDAVKNAPPVDIELNVEEYRKGWRKARENTSSGPSGLHFGHFKAGAEHDGIAEFEAIMANIPYRTGHSPESWQRGTNCMLLKKKDNFRVDKLRTILLYEADFNQNNKRAGRDMMYNAEQHGTIAKEQYGSRKGLSANDHSLNKRLTFDILRQKRKPGAHTATDALSCYDRIVHAVAGLAMRQQGLPQGPIVCMFSTIQRLLHYVRTIYGDSELFFDSNSELYIVPIQGVGQGNGAGPQIWAVVSSPVLEMLRDMGYGCFFRMAISGEELSFVGYAFVDDADLVVTAEGANDDYEAVAQQMQKAMDEWEGGIRATGGAVEPSKTHWYLIDFRWTNGDWRYATPEETPAFLTVLNCKGERLPLERLASDDAQRTLGVRQAPDGNNEAQFQYMVGVAKEWADNIRTGHLPRRLTWQSLNTAILKTLEYPLTATTLTEKECGEIMKPILKAGLSHSGIVSTLPRDLVFSPIKYQGLGLPDLYVTQGITHIQQILKFCRSQAITGTLLRCSMEELKVELGLPGPVLSKAFSAFGILATDSWLKHTWKFLSSNDMAIEDVLEEIPERAENDQYLMQAFYNAGFRGWELRRLNLCRLYLQVATISDLVTADGKTITLSAWEGQTDNRTARPAVEWPNQGRPGSSDWQRWQSALVNTFGLSRNRSLEVPIGNWKDKDSDWHWFYDPLSERLYHRKEDASLEYFPRAALRASRNALMKFIHSYPTDELPPSAIRASVEQQRSYWCLKAIDHRTRVQPETPNAPDDSTNLLQQTIDSLPDEAKWAVQEWSGSDDGAILAEAIRSGTAIGVSDGSFKDAYGTACLVLEGKDSTGRIVIPSIIPGQSSDQSAYRSELGGLFGLTVLVDVICRTHGVSAGSVEVGCDGAGALKQALEKEGEVEPTWQQFDLIAAIRDWKQHSPVKWKTRHILGHQDDNPNHVLDRWATLNCEMDRRAKEHHQQHYLNQQMYQQNIAGEPWRLLINGDKICRNFKLTIIDHVRGTRAKKYWDRKNRFKEGSSADVDWQATGDAMKSMPRARQHWLTKHASGFCATGKMMKRRGEWTTAKCPRCDEEIEDNQHVLQCRGAGAKEQWQEGIKSLRKWTTEQGTSCDISAAISDGLQAWYNNETPELDGYSREIQEVMQLQTKIGWQALLEGCPARGWAELQAEAYAGFGSKKSGRRWVAALIKKLAETAWQMWDHRNAVNTNNETAMASLEINNRIRSEFNLGFRTLDREARQLARRKPLRTLLQSSLEYRRAWMTRITAARSYQERLREERRPPREVLETIGYVEWIRQQTRNT